MSNGSLKITGATVTRPAAAADGASPAPLQLSLSLENPGDQALHVWAGWRAYDYDAATHVLTVYLTSHTPPLPPGITLISDHPRTPAQVVVAPRAKLKIKVEIPSTIRRRTAGAGKGISFVEEPISQVDRVDTHLQFAPEAFETRPHETPEQHRSRLLAHGDVARATISTKEEKE